MTRITDKAMQAKATGRDQWLHEPFSRGGGVFAARITASGERLFYFRYSDPNGKRPYLKLGAYSQRGVSNGLTVEQARNLAQEQSNLYREGVRDLHAHHATVAEAVSVSAEVEKRRAEADLQRFADDAARAAQERERRISIRKLFERWRDTELQPHIRADGKRVGRKDGGQFTEDQFERRVFPSIGSLAACEVRKPHLMEILDQAKSEGKLRTANVLYADLKQMFRFAQIREIVASNPLELVTKKDVGGASVERERVLSSDEIVALANAIPEANLGARSRAAIWITLATGARVGELMGATWADGKPHLVALVASAEQAGAKLGFVDLAAGTWHLPTTKNQREHTIHLSNFALKQFTDLFILREVGPWVFTNTAGDGPVSVKSFGKQLADRQRPPERRLRNRSAKTSSLLLPGGRWTAHDLRRTTATLMSKLGISTDAIEECLNHMIASRVAKVYNRDRRRVEQAKAFDAIGNYLEGLLEQANLQTTPSLGVDEELLPHAQTVAPVASPGI